MSIIIRLQNLPWSANSVDIRRYFSGLSIPEGGVHIVGGEMGDAFIAFSTDEDARLAMAKDGGKIKDMQIKLLLSSRAEMMRVIEQARQQNLVVQPQILTTQPAVLPIPQQIVASSRIMTPLVDSDRRRGRSPSPRRSRDKSPGRDRRRSPDRRSSKRDRSRSPVRSSRGSSRDIDRRGDRFKRDERRYEDPSRYRDDRRSPREFAQEGKKYPDADHVNSRSQLHSEGFRDASRVAYDQIPSIAVTNSYPYSTQQSLLVNKDFPAALYTIPASDSTTTVLQPGIQQKPLATPSVVQRPLSSNVSYGLEQMQYHGAYNQTTAVSKKETLPSNVEPRRRTRFEPEYTTPQSDSAYAVTDSAMKGGLNQSSSDSSMYNGKSDQQPHHTAPREVWPRDIAERPAGSLWNENRPGLLDPPNSKVNDFNQVSSMNFNPSNNMQSENGTYQQADEPEAFPSYVKGNASPRNDDLRRDMPGRVPSMINDYQGRGPASLTLEIRRLRSDTRIEDILEMFRGIPLSVANVHIQSDVKGVEKALVRFLNAADFEEAFSRNHHFLRDGLCELVPCPDAAFDSALRLQKPRLKPTPREEDLCIQLRGLPFSCKEDDVVQLFDGLGILDIFIDIGPDGRATGIGFVEFGTQEDFRAALAMNGKMIGHRYITVSIASKEMMAEARGEEYIPNEPSAPPQFSAQSSQSRVSVPVPNRQPPFLQNRQPPSSQGRPPPPVNQGRPAPSVNQGRPPPSVNQGRPPLPVNQGRPPLPVNQGRPPQPPANQNRPPLVGPGPDNQGRSPISANQGRSSVPANQGRPPQPPANQNRMPPPGNQGRPPPPPCISMRGLPEGVTNRDIADFFGQVNVMPRAIHIMLRPDKMPSGDAFAELSGPRDYEAALDMDGKVMHGHRISVKPITFREMSEVLRRPAPLPPPPTPGPLLRTPGQVERPRRPLFPQGRSTEGPFRERPRLEPPRSNRPLLEPFNRMEPPGRPPFGRMRVPFPGRPFGPKGRFPPPPSDRSIKEFGSPGCVVSINNLHFGAGLEEILDFFRGYNLSKDSVIRKYNENGQTTGEARVSFQNPRDAQRAIRELNQKPIMGRSLTLSLL